jgi:hypothetical protein
VCRRRLPSPASLPRVYFQEFFATNIRNPQTRRTYYQAADDFSRWCPRPVSPWSSTSRGRTSGCGSKHQGASCGHLWSNSDPRHLRSLFHWLFDSEVTTVNPAYSVTPLSRRPGVRRSRPSNASPTGCSEAKGRTTWRNLPPRSSLRMYGTTRSRRRICLE